MTSGRPRVAIDAHTIGRRATGNETYVRGLLSGLVEREDVEPIALVDAGAPHPDWLNGHTAQLHRRKAIPRLALELASARRRWGAELLHVQYVRPPRSDVPVVTTIHDISFEHFPALFTPRTRLRMRLTIPWSARHSSAVVTGSQYSRDDLVSTYGLASERVHVTPYAAERIFRRLAPDDVDRARIALGVPDAYVLCVGNLQPRKNLPRLLEAFVAVRASGHDVPLIIVGQAAWLYDEVFETVRRHALEDAVRFTGFVTTEQLVGLYNAATVFVYPSLFEGFGLPVLEALACGTPTVTSSVSSLPEVAGAAAVLVDPTSVDAIAEGMSRVLEDEVLRDQLAAAGPLQASRFSWERCAAQTAAVYHQALGS